MRLLAYAVGVCLLAGPGWLVTPSAAPLPFGINEPPALAQVAELGATLAQTEIDAPIPAAPVDGATVPAVPAPQVDETALRYFAQQGDTVRLQREIERLRALYPNWQPPADLTGQDYVADPDIIAMWELYAVGDYAAARAAIAAKQQADPSFVPSDDLLRSLTVGEAGQRLRNASDAGSSDMVISIAANTPELMTCGNVDALWRLAAAFAATENTPRATDAYSYILINCTDPGERLATVQKAMELLDRDELAPLLALEKTDAAGTGEFSPLRADLARRAVAASLEADGAAPLPADVALLESEAERAGNPEDLRLLGYYELGRSRTNEARLRFEQALAADSSAASAEALGVALLQLRDAQAAEATLRDYRDENDAIAALYLDAAAAMLATEPRLTLDATVLGRIVDAVMAARDGNVAQELGWYAYAFQQPQTALEWFKLALLWQSDLEPAAYGLMVAANALGDSATVESVRSQWGTRSARIASFGNTSAAIGSASPPLPQPRPVRPQQVTPQPVSSAPSVAATATTPLASSGTRGCQGFVPPMSLSPGAALGHAWCLMELNRPAQAADHFARALHSSSERTRSDAAYGQSLAFLRLGLADEAAVAAASAPLPSRRAMELEIAILTQKATAAYDIGDYARALNFMDTRALYAPERNDLLTLRAWSYYHLRRFGEAQRIFAAVAATGYGEAVVGLDAATTALAQAQQQ
jgi:tetratricopeptide (TPR) repeat protein